MVLLSPFSLIASMMLAAQPAPSALPTGVAAPPMPELNKGWICSAEHRAWVAEDGPVVERSLKLGLAGGDARLPELERILARAPDRPVAPIERCADATFVHDGRFEPAARLAGLVKQANAGESGPLKVAVVASPLPYAYASLLVGSINVEAGRYDRALAALERGAAFAPADPGIASERAGALNRLHRSDEAVAVCDALLASGGVFQPVDEARVNRARGYALGDLGRYREAIAAYERSQALDPGETVAARELVYLRGRQAGRGPSATELTTSDKTRKPDAPR